MRDTAPRYEGFRIYPRGFLGADLGIMPQDVLRPYEQQVQRHTFHPNMLTPDKPDVEVNRNVEELWSYYLRHKGALMSFDFREKVWKVALSAFGTQDFMQWVRTQYEGPVTGELHTKFLDDTLGFILTGRRSLQVAAWGPMLLLRDIQRNVTPPPHKAFVHDFFVEKYSDFAVSSSANKDTPVNTKLQDVLIRWGSHEGGLDDLIQTLHLLFGDLST